QLAEQVVAPPLEPLVGAHPDVDVQVARTAPAGPRRAPPGEPHGPAVLDARRDLDGVGLLLHHPALALAGRAGVLDDRAQRLAPGARAGGDHLAQDRLADPPDLAGTAAVGAGDRVRAGLGPRPLALAAHDRGADGDRRLGAEHGLLEVERDGRFEIRTARR